MLRLYYCMVEKTKHAAVMRHSSCYIYCLTMCIQTSNIDNVNYSRWIYL